MGRFTNKEKWQCAEREIGQRKYVYDRRVAEKRMTQEKADRELALMTEIRDEYREKAEVERAAGDLFGQAQQPAEGRAI